MSRRAAALLVLAGCGAELGNGTASDASRTDSPSVPIDARVDAPIDGPPCVGPPGSSAMTGPDGSCFIHITTTDTYINARAACVNLGGHLAYIKDASLDTFAEAFIGTSDTYLGGTDSAVEGTFVWEDSTAFSFTAWHTGEPNNGGTSGIPENCAIIAGARTGKGWDDRPCAPTTQLPAAGLYTYLCQK